MSISIATAADPAVQGNTRVVIKDITLDTSYPTGGYSLTAADLGLTRVLFAVATVKAVSGTTDITQVQYDLTNSKLQVFDQTPAEIANATSLASDVVRVIAWGK